jgi:hypothetical protein
MEICEHGNTRTWKCGNIKEKRKEKGLNMFCVLWVISSSREMSYHTYYFHIHRQIDIHILPPPYYFHFRFLFRFRFRFPSHRLLTGDAARNINWLCGIIYFDFVV